MLSPVTIYHEITISMWCDQISQELSKSFSPTSRVAQIVAAWLPENGEWMRKWRGNGERITLYISSFNLYFLPLCPFPISKIVSFCRKMWNTTLLSGRSQKTHHTCYEKIILGRIRCEKAQQVLRAWLLYMYVKQLIPEKLNTSTLQPVFFLNTRTNKKNNLLGTAPCWCPPPRYVGKEITLCLSQQWISLETCLGGKVIGNGWISCAKLSSFISSIA